MKQTPPPAVSKVPESTRIYTGERMGDAGAIPDDPRRLVDQMLGATLEAGGSDLHLEPEAGGYEVRARIDGLLQPIRRLPPAMGRSAVTRLMVLAQLLTYRQDIPQEGRFSVALPSLGRAVEMRLAVMPTTHGLRAAVRMPAELVQPRRLEDLNLPPATLQGLRQFAGADAGMLILCGPAGTGKTTTIYALLEYLVREQAGLSIISIEDPVERDVPGVTQIEVSPFGELTYERALRSVLRQDPQVLVVGEIRDRVTAQLAAQAAMSGHRLIATLHAATAGGAIVRLLEMGLEPYQLTSSLFGVVPMRLLRRRSEGGYRGRVPLAAFAAMTKTLRQAVLAGDDAQSLETLLEQTPGYRSLRDVADEAVAAGVTDEAEVARVLGSPSQKD